MSTATEQKLALNAISEILEQIDQLFKKAETIADEAGVSFSYSGPTYGMGGYYTSPDLAKAEAAENGEDWSASDDESIGWSASSQSC